MSSAATRTPADVARAVFDAVSKRPRWHRGRGSAGVVDNFVAIGEFRGHDAVRAFFRELFAALPDFTMTVDRIVADDAAAVVQWHAAGTFTGGPFQGIAPTGRRVEVRGVDAMEIADGLVQHNTIYYDGATFARQNRLLPGLGSRADQALPAAFSAKTTLIQRVRDRRRRNRPGPEQRSAIPGLPGPPPRPGTGIRPSRRRHAWRVDVVCRAGKCPRTRDNGSRVSRPCPIDPVESPMIALL